MLDSLYFGTVLLFRGPHDGEILDPTRMIEDSQYISTNKLVERMLISGQFPSVPDELYDDMEATDDPQIPEDAILREPDADITDAGHVADKLQFRVEGYGADRSGEGGSSVEGTSSSTGELIPEE